jgi:hypothetical protein
MIIYPWRVPSSGILRWKSKGVSMDHVARRLTINGLHGVIFQKTELFITTAVRTSEPAIYDLFCTLCILITKWSCLSIHSFVLIKNERRTSKLSEMDEVPGFQSTYFQTRMQLHAIVDIVRYVDTFNPYRSRILFPTGEYIVTCYLRRHPIQRFIARKQLRKHATVLEPLLGSSPRVTMEVQSETVFSMWSAPRLYHAIDSSRKVSV